MDLVPAMLPIRPMSVTAPLYVPTNFSNFTGGKRKQNNGKTNQNPEIKPKRGRPRKIKKGEK